MLFQTARDIKLVFTQQLIVSFLGIVYLIVIARLIPSVSDLGILSSFVLFVSLITMISTLSMGSAASRYIALEYGRGRRDLANGVFRQILKIALLMSIFSFGISLLFVKAFLVALIGLSISNSIALLLCLDIFALVLYHYFEGSLKGLQKFKSITATSIANNAIRSVLAILFLILRPSLESILVGWVLGDYAGLLIIVVLSFRNFRGPRAGYPLKQLFKFSLPLWLNSLVAHFASFLDRYLVAFLAGTYVLGIYSPAVTASGILSIISVSINTVLFPRLSQMVGNDPVNIPNSALRTASRYSYLIYTPLAFGLAAVSYPVSGLLGQRYLGSTLPLMMIAFSLSLTVPTSIPLFNILLARGKSWIFPFSNILSIAVSAALAFALIPNYREIGAAFAKSGSILCLLILPIYILKKEGAISLDLVMLRKSLFASLLMAAILILIELATSMATELLPLYVLLGGSFYLLGLCIFRVLSTEDVSLIASLFPNKISIMVHRIGKFLVL